MLFNKIHVHGNFCCFLIVFTYSFIEISKHIAGVLLITTDNICVLGVQFHSIYTAIDTLLLASQSLFGVKECVNLTDIG